MTKEEAKEYWTAKYEAARNWDDPHWEASERKDHRRYVDALKAAIEALSEHNCVKCKHYYETEEDSGTEGHCKMDTAYREEARKKLMEFVRMFESPSLEATAHIALSERTGEWLEVEVFPEVYDIEGVKTWGSEMQCDQCGFRHTAIEGHMAQYNYCPNCGANMEIKIRILEGNNETS